MLTHSFFDPPLPVGNRAVTNSKPYSKNKPTGGGDDHKDKMKLSGRWKNPAKKIKPNNG